MPLVQRETKYGVFKLSITFYIIKGENIRKASFTIINTFTKMNLTMFDYVKLKSLSFNKKHCQENQLTLTPVKIKI